jgi:uncharacterized membrane protein YbhN (UPF0104 family)
LLTGQRPRRWFGAAARPVLSLALLALVIHSLDIDKLRLTVSSLDTRFTALAVGVLAISPLISVPRWQAILAALGWPRPFALLTRALYVGAFFSQVLPSSVGGDVWRIWHCARTGVPATTSAYSVLIERFAGVCATLVFFAASFGPLLARIDDPPLRWALWVLLVGFIGGAGTVATLSCASDWISRLRLLAPIAGLARALATVGRSGRLIAIMAATAVLGQLVASIGYFALARSVGASLSFGDCIATMPPVLLIALVPISLGGWGLREGAFVVILKCYGIPTEQALLLSVSFGLALVMSTLPGLALWWWQPIQRNSTDTPVTQRVTLWSKNSAN